MCVCVCADEFTRTCAGFFYLLCECVVKRVDVLFYFTVICLLRTLSLKSSLFEIFFYICVIFNTKVETTVYLFKNKQNGIIFSGNP